MTTATELEVDYEKQFSELMNSSPGPSIEQLLELFKLNKSDGCLYQPLVINVLEARIDEVSSTDYQTLVIYMNQDKDMVDVRRRVYQIGVTKSNSLVRQFLSQFPEDCQESYRDNLWNDNQSKDTCMGLVSDTKYGKKALNMLKTTYLTEMTTSDIEWFLRDYDNEEQNENVKFFWKLFLSRKPSVEDCLKLTHYGKGREKYLMSYIVKQKPDKSLTLKCLGGIPSRYSPIILKYALKNFGEDQDILLDIFEGLPKRARDEFLKMVQSHRQVRSLINKAIVYVESIDNVSLTLAVINCWAVKKNGLSVQVLTDKLWLLIIQKHHLVNNDYIEVTLAILKYGKNDDIIIEYFLNSFSKILGFMDGYQISNIAEYLCEIIESDEYKQQVIDLFVAHSKLRESFYWTQLRERNDEIGEKTRSYCNEESTDTMLKKMVS